MRWGEGLLPLVVVGALFVLLGCERSAWAKAGYGQCEAPGVSRSSEGEIAYCGPIRTDMVDAFERTIRPEDQLVVLTSAGGNARDGLRMAKMLKGRDVLVRGFCLSSCSTHLLPAAQSIEVAEGAVVAFHHTVSFLVEVAVEKGLPANAGMLALAAEERALFTRPGLDPAALDRLPFAITPTCWRVREAPGGQNLSLRFRHAWFIPRRSEAERLYGRPIKGYWPNTLGHARATIRSITGKPESVIYGWPSYMPTDLAAARKALPQCPPQPLSGATRDDEVAKDQGA